ncbi:septum formation initiator family protein [Lentibacillus sp. CBA3610]|uniref:FtsB family cell division protein n=1 Tax=Lentibacillus sp. CBA3610 TaxID=2518176 RepID=UPI001595B87E|nr:septum formation initiator family protein [Lentibacillus sp. CBA3610]QKY70902.1 septum formation initiator family protein [Lentibacillus sp. CBA3610]
MPLRKKNVARLDSNYMQQYDAYIERQKRKKQRLMRRLVLFSIVVAIAVGSLTAYHFNQRALYAEKEDQYEQLRNEMATLENEEQNLKEEINLLNDEEYVLDIARTNYFFSQEGELIFKVPDEEPSY